MDLQLNGWRGSNKVLEFKDVAKGFEAAPDDLFTDLNLLIRHGERVGLVGPNGAGKSVLLKMILDEMAPDGGEIIIGPSVTIGYYAQQHETLDRDQTLIDLIRHAKECSEGAAVAFLRKFLFLYEQCRQRIGDLSGGERSRLQLALLMLSGANFLLLDEPTNNLDIASAEVLEDTLQNFEGTVLCVSHDRYFLDRVTTRTVELERGQTREYPGRLLGLHRAETAPEIKQRSRISRLRLRLHLILWLAANGIR